MGDAIISECGLYRYRLDRQMAADPKELPRSCCFIMLNPSTADAELDDPTIRRCKSFAWGFNCGHLIVVNLFAFRATKPADLYKAPDPVGPSNDEHIAVAIAEARDGVVVCAWGSNEAKGRDWRVKKMAEPLGISLKCLGTTKGGAPRHPLYVAGNTTLKDFCP